MHYNALGEAMVMVGVVEGSERWFRKGDYGEGASRFGEGFPLVPHTNIQNPNSVSKVSYHKPIPPQRQGLSAE